jgi:hypothetical protein
MKRTSRFLSGKMLASVARLDYHSGIPTTAAAGALGRERPPAGAAGLMTASDNHD